MLVCPPARLLIACLFEPCSRLEPPALANRGGLFGGTIRDGGFRCFCQIWFYWVDALLPACPPANRGGLFGGAIRDGGLGCFCQIWFYWVDALLLFVRRATKIRLLLCPRNLAANACLIAMLLA